MGFFMVTRIRNLLVTPENKIAILDYGLTGALTGRMQDTPLRHSRVWFSEMRKL